MNAVLVDLITLSAQAAAAIIAIELMRRWILPALPVLHHPELVLDVWGPVALALPLIIVAGRVEMSVSTSAAGWAVIGGPAGIAMLTLAICLMIGRAKSDPTRRQLILWSTTGLVLFLLTAAGTLTIWVGQCCFAAGAVSLWINTPMSPATVTNGPTTPLADSQRGRAGVGLLIVLGLAVVQGVAGVIVSEPMRPVGLVIIVVTASLVIAIAAFRGGPDSGRRLGMWAAAYAALFAVGVLSLRVMLPHSLRVVLGSDGPPPLEVAMGFGRWALDALILLLMPALIAVTGQWAGRGRSVAGVVVLLAAAVLVAVRLAAFSL